MIASLASTADMPVNRPELTSTSFSVCSTNGPSVSLPSAGATTGRIGRSKVSAKSWSR
jgi:hypothetical protein